MPLSPLLKSYDNVLLDLDGVVWVGNAAVPGAAEAISEVRSAGKRIVFLTNNSRRSPEDYVRQLWSFGIKASLEEMVTGGAALQHFLAGREPGRVYVIGSPAIFRHVSESGQRIVNGRLPATEAQIVVVAGHDDFDYGELREGTQALVAGAEMVAVDRDPAFPVEDELWPGTGAIVAALEYASGRRATAIVGKPEPQIFHTAIDRLDGGRTLMVGDRLDSDLAGAAAAGLDAAIVLSGVSSREQAEEATEPAPVAVAADLQSLVLANGR